MDDNTFEIIKLSNKPNHHEIKNKLSNDFDFQWFYDNDAGDCAIKDYNDICLTLSLIDNNLYWFTTGEKDIAGDVDILTGINLRDTVTKLSDIISELKNE